MHFSSPGCVGKQSIESMITLNFLCEIMITLLIVCWPIQIILPVCNKENHIQHSWKVNLKMCCIIAYTTVHHFCVNKPLYTPVSPTPGSDMWNRTHWLPRQQPNTKSVCTRFQAALSCLHHCQEMVRRSIEVC